MLDDRYGLSFAISLGDEKTGLNREGKEPLVKGIKGSQVLAFIRLGGRTWALLG